MKSLDDLVAEFRRMQQRIIMVKNSEPEFLYVGREEYDTLLNSYTAVTHFMELSLTMDEPHKFMGIPLIEVREKSHFNLVSKG